MRVHGHRLHQALRIVVERGSAPGQDCPAQPAPWTSASILWSLVSRMYRPPTMHGHDADDDRIDEAGVDRPAAEVVLGPAEAVTAVAISGRKPPNQPLPRW